MTLALATFRVAQAAPAVYISNCCNHPSTVAVFNTGTLIQTGQFAVGTGAWDAVFSPDGVYAYVSNNVAQSVSVVQISTQTLVATIPVGYNVEWMVISPDGKRVFVGSFENSQLGHLVAIDTGTRAVVKTLALGGDVTPMAISADGKKLYTDYFSSNNLLVIDTQSLTVTATVPIVAGISVALTPDGKFAYVPNLCCAGNYSPNVAVVDTATNTVVTTIALNPRLDPTAIAISPDGSVAYVAQVPLQAHTPPTISVIQIGSNRVIDTIRLTPPTDPGKIVFSPDSSRAYLIDFASSAVDVLNVAQEKLIAALPILGSARGLAISPDGAALLAPNFGSSQAAAVDPSSGATLASIPIGDMNLGSSSFPAFGGAAASPDGRRVYVTNFFSDNVSVVDTASNIVIASVPAGGGPVGVVLSPDGSIAYVADQNANAITAINTATFATTQINMPFSGYPTALAITPDGKFVYVTDDNIVPDFGRAICYTFVIDTSKNAVAHTIITPYPVGVAVSPDGSRAYVLSGGGGGTTSLFTISTASNRITGSLQLDNFGPLDIATAGIAVTPDGTRIFADNSQTATVYEIDAQQNKVLKAIPVGTLPGQLAMTADGSQVWAADYMATFISAIDVATATVARTVSLGNPSYGVAITPK